MSCLIAVIRKRISEHERREKGHHEGFVVAQIHHHQLREVLHPEQLLPTGGHRPRLHRSRHSRARRQLSRRKTQLRRGETPGQIESF